MTPSFSVRSPEDRRDLAVSEIIGTLLIIALVLVFASLVVIISTDIDLPEKTAYICVSSELEDSGGLELISVRNNGGDSALYNPSEDAQNQVVFRIESSESEGDVTTSGDELEWSPGTALYIYNSDSGYHVTDSLSDIRDAKPLPGGDIRLVVSDARENVLIYSTTFQGSGVPFHHDPGFSVEAWVKWNKDPALGERWATIAVYGNSDNNRCWWLGHIHDNSKFEFGVVTSSEGRRVISVTKPEKDVWYHVVGVYNQNLTSDNLCLYVNGQDATQSYTHSPVTGDLKDSPGPLQIGGSSGINYPSSGSRKIDGEIRGFNTYDYALSPAEISAKYAAGRP